MHMIEWLEVAIFGNHTGTPGARREFARRQLLASGFRPDAVDQTLHEEDDRLRRAGTTW